LGGRQIEKGKKRPLLPRPRFGGGITEKGGNKGGRPLTCGKEKAQGRLGKKNWGDQRGEKRGVRRKRALCRTEETENFIGQGRKWTKKNGEKKLPTPRTVFLKKAGTKKDRIEKKDFYKRNASCQGTKQLVTGGGPEQNQGNQSARATDPYEG